MSDSKKFFILFTHYSVRQESLEDKALRGRLLRRFKNRCQVLKAALNRNRYDGRIYLFLDLTWPTMVQFQQFTRDQVNELVQLGSLKADLESRLPYELKGKVKIVTVNDLRDLLDELELRAGSMLGKFLVGGLGRLTYDAPKIVEAAVRIAYLGSTIPVLRFDDDVLFASRQGEFADKEDPAALRSLLDGIEAIVEEYWARTSNPYADYFIISGAYMEKHSQKRMIDGPAGSLGPMAALDGFATRTLPAYRVDFGTGAFMPEKKAIQGFLKSLRRVGAHPLFQVVSGAGLCMSDSAILDLPPFSNMRGYVMWIDDHLKYALHDELGHFATLNQNAKRGPGKFRARVDKAVFPQTRYAREIEIGDFQWTTREYIPRLLRGCVAHGWLRDPKLARQNLSNKYRREHFLEYGRDLAEWIRAARIEKNSRQDRLRKLKTEAYETLSKLAMLWGGETFKGTLIYHFVTGQLAELGCNAPVGMDHGLFCKPKKQHVIQGQQGSFPKKDFSRGVQEMVTQLAEDFCRYGEFVLFWPNFVQAVRWLPNKTDLRSWLDIR
jgi:hypothetical protein